MCFQVPGDNTETLFASLKKQISTSGLVWNLYLSYYTKKPIALLDTEDANDPGVILGTMRCSGGQE